MLLAQRGALAAGCTILPDAARRNARYAGARMSHAIDVSGLVPEARAVTRAAAEVYLQHLAPWFVGLLAHGSAVKGGVIPGWSDIDLHLYLDDAAFTPEVAGHPSRTGYLPLSLTVAIQRDLATLDPAPFYKVQCYAMGSHLPESWVGPVPGAYHVIAGAPPIHRPTRELLRANAAARMREMEPFPDHLRDNLLEVIGQERVEHHARLLGTAVWPSLYNFLVLRGDDPLEVWTLPKQEAMARLDQNAPPAPQFRAYYDAVTSHRLGVDPMEGALAVIERGVECLHAVKRAAASYL
jgi:hypothetical protein